MRDTGEKLLSGTVVQENPLLVKPAGMREGHAWHEVRKLSLRVIISAAWKDGELVTVACDADMRVGDIRYAIEFAIKRARRKNDRASDLQKRLCVQEVNLVNRNDAIIDEKMRIDRVPFLRPTTPSSEDDVVNLRADVWPGEEYDLRLNVVGDHLRPTACNGDLVQVVGCSGQDKEQREQLIGKI